MVENLEKHLNENEYGRKLANEFAELMLPTLVAALIENNLLDIDKCGDREYVHKVILENISEISELITISITFDKEIICSIKSEIEAERYESAVILAGTCIEHLLNSFYIELLKNKHSFSKANIYDALKATSIADKTSWFFRLAVGYDFDSDLHATIKQINSVRNQFVHYKPIPEELDDQPSFEKFRKKVDQLKLLLITTIEQLSTYLNDVKIELSPSRAIANEIVSAFWGISD